MDELEVGEQGTAVVLEKNGLAVADVEGGAVGELHLFEGGLFGEDFFNVGLKEGIC